MDLRHSIIIVLDKLIVTLHYYFYITVWYIIKGMQMTLRDYMQSAELKSREKFSLRHILDGDTDLQFQFASQSSPQVHSSCRPKTMYGQKVRNLLNDENRKAKLKTDIKIKRQMSSATVRRQESVTKNATNQGDKLKLKKALGKVNLLAEEALNLNEQEEIQCIIDLLTCLSETNNHYQSAFVYLTKKIKELIYANPYDPSFKTLKLLSQQIKDQFLFGFIYRPTSKVTYSSLSKKLMEIASSSINDLENEREEFKQNQQNNQNLIKQKVQLIKKLKRELKYYSEHPSEDVYPYVRQLQQQSKQVKKERQELMEVKRDYQFNLQIMHNTNMLLNEQVETLKGQIYQIEMEKLSGMANVEKNSELKVFEDNVVILKGMLDKSKLKMEGMKEEYDKLKKYNEKLISQRSQLAKRAAVGFSELTPRPNLKEIFKYNNLFYHDFVPYTSEESTESKVKAIIQNLKKLKKEPPQKSKKVKEQKKEFEEEGFADDVINEIDQTRNQVDRATQAMDDVKKSYQKQKLQRDNLKKNKKNI